MERLPPIHPGEVLLEDFMKPLGLSQYRVPKDIGVSPIRINQITILHSFFSQCGNGIIHYQMSKLFFYKSLALRAAYLGDNWHDAWKLTLAG